MVFEVEISRGKSISLDEAQKSDADIILKVHHAIRLRQFKESIIAQKHVLEALVRHHVGVPRNRSVTIMSHDVWWHGGFNLLVPVQIGRRHRVVIRLPMPHKLGEDIHPGNIKEKMESEMGTYAYIRKHCPEVPVPHIYGFGFPDGRQYTHIRNTSFVSQFRHLLWQSYRAFRHLPIPSMFRIDNERNQLHINSGYIIMDLVPRNVGIMLSAVPKERRQDPKLVANLYRDISRLFLALARTPQSRIGSLRFHEDASISLSNRPISCCMAVIENMGTPQVMGRDETYSCTDAFISDLLLMHEQRFLSSPNAVSNLGGCKFQMATKTMLRAIAHHYVDRERRNGPFCLQLTDFHSSNILVDENLHITSVLDLEWVCSYPVDDLDVPFWLTDIGSLDELLEHPEYEQVRHTFLEIFEEEERAMGTELGIPLAANMRANWRSNKYWFRQSLESVNCMYWIMKELFLPLYSLGSTPSWVDIMALAFSSSAKQIANDKLQDRQHYLRSLEKLFDDRQRDHDARLQRRALRKAHV